MIPTNSSSSSLLATLVASLRLVGTAVTMVLVGVYANHIGLVPGRQHGLRTLAILSQQVTVPLFLFTKILYCPPPSLQSSPSSDTTTETSCPNVAQALTEARMLLWWPAYVVAMGLLVGWIVTKVCQTPQHQSKWVLAACSFGNSNGLPIALLHVIARTLSPDHSSLWDGHSNSVDPTLFLSIYLLLYPILQWSLCDWLLAPGQSDENRPNAFPPKDTRKEWLLTILRRCLPPPVVGSLAGILVAILPGARRILVNPTQTAPLQWLYTALHTVGEAAVPLNMMLLGCNLTPSHRPAAHHGSSDIDRETLLLGRRDESLSTQSMIGIVVGKMIAMPVVGIASVLLFQEYVWDMSLDSKSAIGLVLMIVCLTPTASNIIVMVELSGSSAKESMARVIALQYLLAPLILSLTMTIAIGCASGLWTL
jgi:predicted permease